MAITTNMVLLKKLRDLIRVRGHSLSDDVSNFIQPVVPMNDDSDVNTVYKVGSFLAAPGAYQSAVYTVQDTAALAQNTDSGSLYTITSAKTYFISLIALAWDGGVGGFVLVGDGNSQIAANQRLKIGFSGTNDSKIIPIPNPIGFKTSINMSHTAVGTFTLRITAIGWEE